MTIVRAAIVRAYRHGGIAWLDVPVLCLVRALGVVLERVGRGRVVEHCVRGRVVEEQECQLLASRSGCLPTEYPHTKLSERKRGSSRERCRVVCAAGCSAIVVARAEEAVEARSTRRNTSESAARTQLACL